MNTNVKIAVGILVLITALVVANLSGPMAVAGTQAGPTSEPVFDSCRNVTFRVKNNRNVAIEIKQIKYYNATKGKWKSENTANGNQRCEKGSTCSIGGGWAALNYQDGEDLADAEGDRLSKIIFVFQDVNSDKKQESQQFLPTDPVCRAGKEYGYGQGWTIGGSSNAGSQDSSDGLGDACTNVSFLVRNETKYGTIYITKVKYFNRNSGKWKTEDVSEVACPYSQSGVVCTIGGRDDLADAKDEDITKISFIYNHVLTGEAFKRSANQESKIFNPQSPRCTEGKVYGTGQGWTIK